MKKNVKPSTAPAPQNVDAATAQQLLDQYKVVVAAERATFRERVKFGAMLIVWEQFLGESRGRGKDGAGLKGWLEEHCTELPYKTAMEYKQYAQRAAAMLGGGAVAIAALLGQSEVIAPNAETIEVDAELIEKRDQLFEDATSRRKMEQLWFDFAKADKKAKKPAAPLPKLKPSDEAAAIWTHVMGVIDKTTVMDAIPLLPAKAASVCYDRLAELTQAMKKHLAELSV